jgi:hypothetical protein
MAHIVSLALAAAIGVLIGANIVLIAAKIARNERLAHNLIAAFSTVTWLLKLGDEGDNRSRTHNGHLRA